MKLAVAPWGSVVRGARLAAVAPGDRRDLVGVTSCRPGLIGVVEDYLGVSEVTAKTKLVEQACLRDELQARRTGLVAHVPAAADRSVRAAVGAKGAWR